LQLSAVRRGGFAQFAFVLFLTLLAVGHPQSARALYDTPLDTWTPNDTVWAAATAPDGTTYIGGDFTSVAQVTGGFVALDADGRVVTLAVAGSRVYAGAQFSTVGNVTRNHLAALNSDGSLADWNLDANKAAGLCRLGRCLLWH
jgi:hypothetical protein